MNLALWLERAATRWPSRPALFEGETCVADYAGFADRTARLAAWLRAQGVVPGDRVGIFMANCTDYLIAFYAGWYAGAAVVPINAKLHAREVEWIAANAGCKLVFVTADHEAELTGAGVANVVLASRNIADAANLDPIRPTARAHDDLAWLFYTSGTTGRPKGVMITHGMLRAMSLSYLADVDDVKAEDGAFYAAPMSHGAGIYNMLHTLRGARHICPASGGFDPAEVLAAGRAQGPLSMFMAPTMLRRLLDVAATDGATGEGLKTIVYGGGPMYLADIEEAVTRMGDRFVQIYGQGECPMCITVLDRAEVADRKHPRWRERLASVGRAQSVVEVAILGADGAALPPGEIGEIAVRGDAVMPGYWQNEAATSDTLKGGWLWTGDMGSMDEDGYVTMRDRSKDMIVSGGSNIYPREVEEVLLMHDSVHEVSVVGRKHAEWGEEVVAFVVPAPGKAMNEAALDALCLDHIARFKRPKAYVAISELPKNNYGKVLKTELRKQLEKTND